MSTMNNMCTNVRVGCFDVSVFLAVLVSVLLRWCTSLYPYSGHDKPPMFGDYEAQRHWMEITSNLPLKDWYTNTTNNDLMYWGLDYPPLTAYHSMLCGYVARRVNPDFVSLRTSRGYESDEHKLFMRASVLVADLLIYIPAILWFFSFKTANPITKPSLTPGKPPGMGDTPASLHQKNNNMDLTPKSLSIFVTLIYPGLILIDYGHFQYNSISLGLFVAAVAAVARKRDLLGSGLFCLAVSYKQMELYHALPFFCYLLGSCIPKSKAQTFFNGVINLMKIACIVIVTFLLVWFPFCRDFNIFVQVLHRLFPLARGVFEDKVGNVWCSLNVIYKFRNMFTNESMARLCLLSTALAILPTSFDLIFKSTFQKFHVSLINSALAFFLFSFQVHEKSILLAAVPVALYFHNDPLTCFWFLLVSVFSMLPLLIKDGLLIPTVALTVFFSLSVHLAFDFNVQNLTNVPYLKQSTKEIKSKTSVLGLHNKLSKGTKKPFESVVSQPYSSLKTNIVLVAFIISMLGCLLLTVCTVILKPPARYPDVYPLLISIYSCIHFLVFFVYFNYVQIFTI